MDSLLLRASSYKSSMLPEAILRVSSSCSLVSNRHKSPCLASNFTIFSLSPESPNVALFFVVQYHQRLPRRKQSGMIQVDVFIILREDLQTWSHF